MSSGNCQTKERPIGTEAPESFSTIEEEEAFEAIADDWTVHQSAYVRMRYWREGRPKPNAECKLCDEMIGRAFPEAATSDTVVSSCADNDRAHRFAKWVGRSKDVDQVTVVAAALIALRRHDFELAGNLARRASAVDHRDLLAQRIELSAVEQAADMKLDVDDWLATRFCNHPFEEIETRSNQDVHSCCSAWLPTPFGRFSEGEVGAFWNSPVAEEIRRSVIDGDFSYCSRVHCPKIAGRTLMSRDVESPRFRRIIDGRVTRAEAGPRRVLLSHDRSCNISCPSCRKHRILLNHEASDRLDAQFEHSIEPLLADARKIKITGSGDPFGSRHFRQLIKRLTKRLPSERQLQLHTNAVLFDPGVWETFGLRDHVDVVFVSVDAAEPETYAVVRRDGDFERLLRNLRDLGVRRARGEFNLFKLDFVVQRRNYREMPDFVRLAKELGADQVYFLLLRNWGTFSAGEFRDENVADPSHPEHAALLQTLADPMLQDPMIVPGTLEPLRKQAASYRREHRQHIVVSRCRRGS